MAVRYIFGDDDDLLSDIVEDLGLGLTTSAPFWRRGHGQTYTGDQTYKGSGRGRRRGHEASDMEGAGPTSEQRTDEEETRDELEEEMGFKRGKWKRFPVPMDIIETPRAHVFVADLPGVSKDDLKVEIEKRVLSICGKRTARDAATDEEGAQVFRKERRGGHVCRRFKLPKNCDAGGVRAEYNAGILRVIVPKKEAPTEKVIQVPVVGLDEPREKMAGDLPPGSMQAQASAEGAQTQEKAGAESGTPAVQDLNRVPAKAARATDAGGPAGSRPAKEAAEAAQPKARIITITGS